MPASEEHILGAVSDAVNALGVADIDLPDCDNLAELLAAIEPALDRIANALPASRVVLLEQASSELTEGATLVFGLLSKRCTGMGLMLQAIGAELRRLVWHRGTGPAHPLASYRNTDYGRDSDVSE